MPHHSVEIIQKGSPYIGRLCPVTRKPLEFGEQVVICHKAGEAFSWASLLALEGRCPYCNSKIDLNRVVDSVHETDTQEKSKVEKQRSKPRTLVSPSRRRVSLSWPTVVLIAVASLGVFGVCGAGSMWGYQQFLAQADSPTASASQPQQSPTAHITPTATQHLAPTSLPTETSLPVQPSFSGTEAGDVWVRPGDDMEMVHVPDGNFPMGSNSSDIDYAVGLCSMNFNDCPRATYEDEQPVHSVSLDGFWIDRTEVTNAQYRRCVEAGVCTSVTTCDWGEPTYTDTSRADHPVVCTSWQQARTYCEWAGAKLPTEAQWEYAARGSEGWRFPWGDSFDGTKANYCDTHCELYWADASFDDGYVRTTPVGSYPGGISWCGAMDMSGNVWEWVADWYERDYYSHSPSRNPTGPSLGEDHIMRGGSWYALSSGIRVAYRNRQDPDTQDRDSDIGFRCIVAP